ncbi:excalibur calcium-binding domain-containing protein [Kocuria rhizophila]|nr:excalibur calcium-binding domain-containing protein [Kocuria rhizophila]
MPRPHGAGGAGRDTVKAPPSRLLPGRVRTTLGGRGPQRLDTRNDVLRRDLAGIDVKPGRTGCTVAAGSLLSPYTGVATAFTAGQDTSSEVQIDHVVALSDASQGRRPLDAAGAPSSPTTPRPPPPWTAPADKSDGDAATWLPPATGERCGVRGHASRGEEEAGCRSRTARRTRWSGSGACPGQPLPRARRSAAHAVADEPSTSPSRRFLPSPPPAQPAPPAAPAQHHRAPLRDLYFSRYVDARAAGMAPLYAAPRVPHGLDGDGDGWPASPGALTGTARYRRSCRRGTPKRRPGVPPVAAVGDPARPAVEQRAQSARRPPHTRGRGTA